MKMETQDLMGTLHGLLGQGQSVVAAAIVSKKGSAPGQSGARMLLRQDMTIIGTVGGGLLEGRVVKEAAAVMTSGQPGLLEIDLSGEMDETIEAICGGVVQVLLERIDPVKENLELFGKINDLRAANQACFLVSRLQVGGAATAIDYGRGLLSLDGHWLAGAMPAAMARELWRRGQGQKTPAILSIGDDRYFFEPFLPRDQVYIVGAGHVALPTAQIASMAGFWVIVMDDRVEFANWERFPWVQEIVVPQGFEDCFLGRGLEASSSVVIVTRGHAMDREVLTQALGTRAGYVGMIGSGRKVASIMDELSKEGFSRSCLDRVHAPIGLPIGGSTPGEIAVSIVAELIQARTKRCNNHGGPRSVIGQSRSPCYAQRG